MFSTHQDGTRTLAGQVLASRSGNYYQRVAAYLILLEGWLHQDEEISDAEISDDDRAQVHALTVQSLEAAKRYHGMGRGLE